jgi:hypothetical protein
MAAITQALWLGIFAPPAGGGGGGAPTPGTLWTFGRSNYGQLGLGNTTNRSSPVQVSGSWSSVAGGYYHSLAKKVI